MKAWIKEFWMIVLFLLIMVAGITTLIYYDGRATQTLLRYHGYDLTIMEATMVDAEKMIGNRTLDLNLRGGALER
jgi:hypothetical protein